MKRFASLVLAMAALPVAGQQSPAASDELHEVLRLQASPVRGSQLYAPCVTCHGREGQGKADGSVPVIAEQHQRVIAKQLVDYRHADRWDIGMEEVVSRHGLATAQDIADLSAHVASLARRVQAGVGDGRNIELGRDLYARDCRDCHGVDGEGNGVLQVPRLEGQHYRYLLRQLHDTLDQRRPNMPPPHRALLGDLDVESLTGLADYLSRLRPPRHVVH